MMAPNRATSVYAIMILAFGVGLWVILEFGAALHAPTDLAGEWESDQGPKMSIEQSGRYFVVSPDRGATLELKLVEQKSLDDQTPKEVRLTLVSDEGSTLIAQGPPRGDEYRFDLKGPATTQSFTARRIRRTYTSPGATTHPTTSPTHARG